jgi:hypothetical protein
MTLYFGTWHYTFGWEINQPLNKQSAIINTVFFSIFWFMMIWSHILAVTTQAGYVPKDKTHLIEERIP